MAAKRVIAVVQLFACGSAFSQVYRWKDSAGTVNYSNSPPPQGVDATKVDIDARPGAPSADTQECYTVRCQGERMEARIAQREAGEARAAAERAAAEPPRPRGLEFRKYISLYRGMSEGELVSVAGAPDLLFLDFSFKTYTWLPTPADPFTTTVTLVSGRVSEIERVRKF
jgi:hypothetical protein